MLKLLLPSALALCTTSIASAASFYLGDSASLGTAIVDNGVADTANAGAITYALHTSPYTNTSGAAESITLTEVNFWNDNAGGSLTPYVALYNGSGIAAAANYAFSSIGDPIAGSAGLNNASFNVGGSNPTFTLNAGDTIVAGFYQDRGMVPFGDFAGEFDYLDEGNELGAGVGGTFGENAQWSNLGRRYSFNIGFEAAPVPEPSVALLLPAALGGLCLLRRRRK